MTAVWIWYEVCWRRWKGFCCLQWAFIMVILEDFFPLSSLINSLGSPFNCQDRNLMGWVALNHSEDIWKLFLWGGGGCYPFPVPRTNPRKITKINVIGGYNQAATAENRLFYLLALWFCGRNMGSGNKTRTHSHLNEWSHSFQGRLRGFFSLAM